MQISVTFRHMEKDGVIRDHVKEKIEKLGKYIENPREVHVVLTAERFLHIAELTIVGDGTTFNSQGRNSDLYTAIDQMVDRMERQIRERKGKGRRRKGNLSLSKSSNPPRSELEWRDPGAEEAPSVQRRRVRVKPMSLDEAIAQFHLDQKEVLFFINSDSGVMNALYRTQEGKMEWIEPHPP
ncbi:MAG: ribosome hibernation-promoting factor, HPF/YfiA family [Thermodesulfobacteriota bacterium]